MSTNEKPRIGGAGWVGLRPNTTAIYNADYLPSGPRYGHFLKPWTVIAPDDYRTFETHAEAIAWAFSQCAAPDPTPQEREAVTTGWAPKPDHADAWQEKWNLTR